MALNKIKSLRSEVRKIFASNESLSTNRFVNLLLQDNCSLFIMPDSKKYKSDKGFLFEAYLDLALRCFINDIRNNAGLSKNFETYTDDLLLIGFEYRTRNLLEVLLDEEPNLAEPICELICEILDYERQQLSVSVEKYNIFISEHSDLEKVLKSEIEKDVFLTILKGLKLFSDFFASYKHSAESRYRVNSIADVSNFLKPIYSTSDTFNTLAVDSELLTSRLVLINLTTVNGHWDQAAFLPSEIIYKLFDKDSSSINLNKITKLIEPNVEWSSLHYEQSIKENISSLCELYKNKKVDQLSFFFYGTSGVGKTLTANAIAKSLGMKILKICFNDTKNESYAPIVNYLLVQAQKSKFVLHFEECQDLVRTDYRGQTSGFLKDVFENFKGVAIFTSNFSADEAFLRRCSYFQRMDIASTDVRYKILKQEIDLFSKKHNLIFDLTEENLQELSSYQLASGHLRWVINLALAKTTDGAISFDRLKEAFHSRLYSQIGSEKENRKIESESGQIPLEFSNEFKAQISSYISYSEKILSGQKPFPGFPEGSALLLSGPSGVGKTALSRELASKLKLGFKKVTASNLLSKYLGESEKQIKALFNEINERKSLILIDEAEGLFRSRQLAEKSWELSIAGELLRSIEDCRGIVIIATNHPEVFDSAFERRFLFHLKFERPDIQTRFKIFKNWNHVFKRTDDELLSAAERIDLSGAEIRNAAIQYYIRGHEATEDFISAVSACVNTKLKQDKVIGL